MRNDYFKKYMLLFALLFTSAMVFAQTRSITGKVVDENNLSLPGATVAIGGTNLAGSTDANGIYKINGVNPGTYQVTVTFIGYNALTQPVTVGNVSATLNFNLTPSAKNLTEVVVIGYGTARKKDLTGSITTVSSKDFQTGNITSPEQLIAGKAAGVSITSNGGAPGAGSTIRVRGGASLSATNDPLIVIDGVQLGGESIPGAPSPLSLINPNDIETFTILKDASATAIYGSRASNGVIIITTKKGVSGTPQVVLNSQVSVSKLIKEVSVLSADQLRDYVKTNGTAQYQGYLGTANTDWQKEIYQTAVSNDNNLSVSGATKNMPYRVSVGFLDQQGILKTGQLYRTSAGVNVSPRFFDNHLKVDINLKGSLSRARFANQDAVGAAISFDPTKPVYSGNDKAYGGYYEYLDGSSATGLKVLAPRNPVGLLEQKHDGSEVKRSIGNAQFDYKFHFLPDLHANVNLGYDISEGKGTIVIPPTAGASFNRFKDLSGVLHSGVNNQYRSTMRNTTFEGYLNYVKDIKSINSRIDAVAGYAYYDYLITNYNFPDMTSDGTQVNTPNFAFDKPQHRLLSYYGRLIYTYADKYTFTGTIRRDGSSRFSPLNRYAIFPSGALAWRIKEESFLKDSKVLSDLKLRVGYGTTGQQDGDIGNYAYTSYYSLSTQQASYQLGSTYYQLYRPAVYDPKRKWEQSATTNVAVDFGFLDGRITGSVDAYYKNTKDLLGLVNAPAGSSFSNQYVTNVGNMVNRGIEFTLNGQIIKSKDLNWNAAVNVTYNENKITKLSLVDDPNSTGQATGGVSGGTGSNVQRYYVGAPRAAFYVYQQVYGADGKPLDGVYVDRNGDGVINDKDLYLYKQPDPKFIFGFSTNVNYKKWNLATVLRANVGNYAYNNVYSSTGIRNNILNPLGYLNNGSTNVLESGLIGANDKNILSDYYVQNASFLKMDNLSLGYAFGNILRSKAQLSINANVQNVFVITNYKGIDPELGNGIDNNIYPRPRTYTLGVNVKF